MCHIRLAGFFLAILAGLSTLPAPGAQAQAASIEQTFAGSLTVVPAENLAVTGAFYVPVYSSVSMSRGWRWSISSSVIRRGSSIR